jgi:hypothetical protein
VSKRSISVFSVLCLLKSFGGILQYQWFGVSFYWARVAGKERIMFVSGKLLIIGHNPYYKHSSFAHG